MAFCTRVELMVCNLVEVSIDWIELQMAVSFIGKIKLHFQGKKVLFVSSSRNEGFRF